MLRDALLLAVFAGIAILVDGWLQSGWTAYIAGAVGFVAGFQGNGLCHEWGHYLGARLAGARAPRNRLGSVFPLFHFDIDSNSHGQFMAMSVGGNLLQWLFAIALLLALDSDSAGRLGLQCGALGFAILSSLTELPIIADALRRGDGRAAWQAYLPQRERVKVRTFMLGMPLIVASLFLV